MRVIGSALTWAATAVLLAGCGSATSPAAIDPAPTGPGRVDGAGRPAAPVSPTEGPLTARCGTDPLAIGNGVADAAAGHRYLALEVRNCTDRTVTLDQAPTIVPVLPSGRRLTTPSEVVDGPGRVTLEPGALAYVGLEWLAGARTPRWADSVEVTVTGLGTATLPLGNFDVNRDTLELRVHPWTTRTDRIWPT